MENITRRLNVTFRYSLILVIVSTSNIILHKNKDKYLLNDNNWTTTNQSKYLYIVYSIYIMDQL